LATSAVASDAALTLDAGYRLREKRASALSAIEPVGGTTFVEVRKWKR
jgi:hypothetical protein